MGYFYSRNLRNSILVMYWNLKYTRKFKNNPFSLVKINKIFHRKIVNIFLPIGSNICFGGSKEPSH